MRRAPRRTVAAATSLALLAVVPEAAAQPACTAPATTCAGANGYYASTDDLDRLTAVTDPLLRELKSCLEAAGASHVTPAIAIRWNSEGNPVAVKVEVPGYESLPCVAKASGKLSQLQNPHETSIRCELGCPKPPPAPPHQPPLVVKPPEQPQRPVPAPPQPAQPLAVPVVSPAKEVQPSVRYERVWYGWQGLIADAVAFTLTLAGGFSGASAAMTMGLVTFGLGTPIVHMAHGEVGRGFASMGVRLLLPLVGSGIGAIAGVASASRNAASDAGDAAGRGAIIGALLAGAGCAAIDAFALGYKSQKVEPEISSGLRPRPWLTLSPTFDVGRDRASLGVGGRF